MGDTNAAEAWIGHPYVDIIDNKSDFESKINRLISCVAVKMGIDIGDRLNVNAKKVKFAINGPLPKDTAFPNFRDFEVTHHYLQLSDQEDPLHLMVNKIRRCFMYNNQYFQLDIYRDPCHPRCKGLMLLETYTTLKQEEFKDRLPKFLNIDQEVT